MATDQEIRDAGYKYIPKQQYLLNPFKIPTAPEEPVVDQGIINTNAFARSGGDNFNPAGNLFGYGTAVQPGDRSVITSGPYAGQSGYYNSINYRGGLPGNVVQKGPGRYFDYGQFNEKGEPVFYKDYTIQPKKELPSWMKAGLAILPGGTFLSGVLENRMNPGMDGMTAAEIDKNYGTGEGGGRYGIAGLSDTQKQYYDALASQGFLFDGPGGMKTLDGKNFSRITEDTINDYFQGKIDKYGSIEEYEDYINQDPTRRRNLKLILNQYKTLQGINDYNYGQEIKDDAAKGITHTDQDKITSIITGDSPATGGGADSWQETFSGGAAGGEFDTTSSNAGTSEGWSNADWGPDTGEFNQGGRVGLRYGGLLSIL